MIYIPLSVGSKLELLSELSLCQASIHFPVDSRIYRVRRLLCRFFTHPIFICMTIHDSVYTLYIAPRVMHFNAFIILTITDFIHSVTLYSPTIHYKLLVYTCMYRIRAGAWKQYLVTCVYMYNVHVCLSNI